MTYKEQAIKLWQMLDDIDTYSDMAKGDEKLYRSLVERKQRERFRVFRSDGYSLFDMEGNVVDYHEGSDWDYVPPMNHNMDLSNGSNPTETPDMRDHPRAQHQSSGRRGPPAKA